MKLESIAERLEGLSLGILRTQSIFIHSMPAENTLGVILREDYVGTAINNEMPGYVKGAFQLIVRAGNYVDALALSKNINTRLRQEGGVLPGISKLNYIRPTMEPYIFPRSPAGLWEASVKWECCYVE